MDRRSASLAGHRVLPGTSAFVFDDSPTRLCVAATQLVDHGKIVARPARADPLRNARRSLDAHTELSGPAHRCSVLGGQRHLRGVMFVVVARPQSSIPDMAGHGVDASTWTPLDWSWAGHRLRVGRNDWLTTVSPGGRPPMPVWGIWKDGEQRFSFSCAPSARKAQNIAANPWVVVTTESTV